MIYFNTIIKKMFNKKFKLHYPYEIAQFHHFPPHALASARKTKLLIFDVDGVFTNGFLYFDESGKEYKGFHVHDGFGFRKLHQLPIKLAVITGKDGGGVKHRIKKQLKVKYAYFGIENKYKIYTKLLKKFRLSPENVAFVGDDIPDVKIMEKIGFPIATANATPYIKHIAAWITSQPGGQGAVRNVADLFIAAYQNDV